MKLNNLNFILRMAEEAGIASTSVSNVTLLRESVNRVYLLDGPDVVLRLGTGSLYTIQRNLDIVNNVAENADVLGSWIQDAIYDASTGYIGTFWKRGDPAKLTKDAHAFGKAIQSLRNVKVPVDLSVCDPLKPVPSRLIVAEELGVPNESLRVLEDMYEEVLSSGYHEMVNSATDLVHRDAHIGNAVKIGDDLKLIDMDTICRGPWQYDFIPSFVSLSVMEKSRTHYFRRVLEGVYDELVEWKWLDLAVLTRKTTMLTWLATQWSKSSLHQKELMSRLETLKTNTQNAWHAL